MESLSTSVTIIAGDFNARVGWRTGTEKCIGSWSRGVRNNNGLKLIEFCESKEKIIANSCFKHPAKHISTWSQKRTDPATNKTINLYTQIDYIILDQKQKQTLTDARAYGGTETTSDHKLVVARMELKWPKVYHKRPPASRQQKFDIKILTENKDIQKEYKENIIQTMQSSREQPTNEETACTHKWDTLKSIIKNVAENQIGYQKKVSKQNISDAKLEKMSIEQKSLRLEIERTDSIEKIKELKKSRKIILKKMNHRIKEIRERRTEELVKEIEIAKDDTKMFKAAKALYTKHNKVHFVHDEQGRCVSQPQEIYNTIENHFKQHFNKNNVNETTKKIK